MQRCQFSVRHHFVVAATCLSVIALSGVTGARAADADASVFKNDEMTVRLVRTSAPVGGMLRAALVIDLAPGWKTYWIDPGASGVPPQIDLSKTQGLATARLLFPAPHRFGEAETRANGYKGKAAIALELVPSPDQTIDAVRASVFMGVCKEICIPVSADLTAAKASEDDNAVVEAAFAALPEPAAPASFTVSAGEDGKTLTVTVKDDAEATGPGNPDLFVTSGQGWFFDAPTKATRNGATTVFEVPIAESPVGATGAPPAVDLVSTVGNRAIAAGGVRVEAIR